VIMHLAPGEIVLGDTEREREREREVGPGGARSDIIRSVVSSSIFFNRVMRLVSCRRGCKYFVLLCHCMAPAADAVIELNG
jgi:hypothetical protein